MYTSTLRKTLRIIVRLFLIFVLIVGLTSISHPIILKWLTGSARLIGRSIGSIVLTDGQVNHDIKVYHIDKHWNGEAADYYILHFPYADNSRLKILCLNRKDNYAGAASSTNIRDYDVVTGLLFQSEVGAQFTPMQDDLKGFNYDPQVSFGKRQITLTIPPSAKELNCDSLRVIL